MNIHDIDTDLDINDLVDSYEHEEVVDIITTDSDDNVVVTFTPEVTKEVVVKEEVTTEEVVVEVKGPTKTEIAQEIFTRMYGQEGIERKHVIALFIKDVQLTKAGAATYYQNFVKKLK